MKQKKTLNIMEYELPVRIEQDKDGGYVAVCRVWEDCYAQGDTLEEVIAEISTVAISLVELYNEEGLKIPLKLTKKLRKQANLVRLNFPVLVSS